MTDSNIFALAQIIKAAGADPSDVTDAVWAAGYRKPERKPDEVVALTLDIIAGFVGDNFHCNDWPKNYAEILQSELNELIFEELWRNKATAISTAQSLINEGYAEQQNNMRDNPAPAYQLVPKELTDPMAEAIAYHANCCGGVAADAWEAALAAAPAQEENRLEPVILPPIMALDGRTGRSLIIANTHNSAVTLCAMAITEAGYKTECSPLLGSEVTING